MNDELKLVDLYFKSIRFNQVRGTNGNIKLQIKHKFEFAKSSDNKTIRCTITTMISSDDMRIDAELQSVGIFLIEENSTPSINSAQNMVNIMYPYIRSQVILVSTQPGILPIQLPVQYPIVEVKKEDNVIFA